MEFFAKISNVENIEQLKKDYNDLPLFDKERIESVINVAVIVAKYLLLENIIKPTMTNVFPQCHIQKRHSGRKHGFIVIRQIGVNQFR